MTRLRNQTKMDCITAEIPGCSSNKSSHFVNQVICKLSRARGFFLQIAGVMILLTNDYHVWENSWFGRSCTGSPVSSSEASDQSIHFITGASIKKPGFFSFSISTKDCFKKYSSKKCDLISVYIG